MTRELVIRPAAQRDLEEAADYLTDHASEQVAHEFGKAAEAAFGQLLEQPHLGRTQEWLASRLRGCRRWRVAKPFQVYQVFYCPSETLVDVVRVLHGSRDIEVILGEWDG